MEIGQDFWTYSIIIIKFCIKIYVCKKKIAQIYSQSRQINGVKTKDNTVLSLVKQINSQKCDFENGHHLKK